MKLWIQFTILLLVGLAAASPLTIDNKTQLITKEFYPKSLIIYRSQHDIVNILAPLHYLNDLDHEVEDIDITIPFFFVEADVDENGKRTDKGLYIFKDNNATKLLDNGRDIATNDETPTQVFFGAQDGIYVYNEDTEEAEKYGSVSDSIIGIVRPTINDTIYILTEDNELFNVTDAGNNKTKINDVEGAKQIMLDYSNNIYFYTEDKQPYVLTPEGVKKIQGLPANLTSVKLLKPPIVLTDGVPVVIDNVIYAIFANGSSAALDFKFKPKANPTADSIEVVLLQYYAYNKNIYEYKILCLLESLLTGDLKDLIQNNANSIHLLAAKTKQKKLIRFY